MKRSDFLKTLVAAGAMCVTGVAMAQSKLGNTYEEILAGAKQEGKLVAWITSPRSPQAQTALIEAFNKRFGLSTKLEWVPNSAVTANTRAAAEAGGGKVSVDIIGAGAIQEVKGASDAKLIKAYPWGQVFGKALPQLATLQALELAEFKNMALPYQQVAYGLAWNPNMIKEADLPSKFSDLTDPKWKGKFGVNAFFMTPIDVIGFSAGNAATLDLAKKLMANGPVFEV